MLSFWTYFLQHNNQKCLFSSESVYYNDFWRSCGTEDWSNDAENTALHHRNKLHFTIYYNRNSYFKLQKYFTILNINKWFNQPKKKKHKNNINPLMPHLKVNFAWISKIHIWVIFDTVIKIKNIFWNIYFFKWGLFRTIITGSDISVNNHNNTHMHTHNVSEECVDT